jgi:archaellin
MRHSTIVAIALAAVPAAAFAAEPQWGYYQDDKVTKGLLQAAVQSKDGEQLIFKCEKKGKGQVVAVLFSKSAFSPPRNSYVMRPVTVQVDKGRAMEERWRYFGQTITAVDMKNERSLTTLVEEMEKGTELHLRVNPESGSSYEITFPVQGAHEALGRVYESCGDTYPAEVPAA